jgi:hypothetical protein
MVAIKEAVKVQQQTVKHGESGGSASLDMRYQLFQGVQHSTKVSVFAFDDCERLHRGFCRVFDLLFKRDATPPLGR